MALEQQVQQVRRRVALAAFSGALLRHGAALLAVVACLVMVLRLFLRVEPWPALAPLGLAPLTAFLDARRRFIGEQTAAAWLDQASGGTGGVLTAIERPDALWQQDASARRPGMRLPWTWPVAGLAFLGLAFLVPVSDPPEPGLPAVPQATLDKLEDQLEALQEVAELEPEEIESVEETLQDLRDATEPSEAGLEAMDRVEDQLGAMAQELQAANERAQEALAQARKGREMPDRSAVQRALEQMSAAGLAHELPQELAEALAALDQGQLSEFMRGLDPSQLQAMSEAMLQALKNKELRLIEAELIPGTCDDPQECEEAMLIALGGMPGSGGISRGPGDADLTWGEERADRDALFSPEILPPGQKLALEQSMVIGEVLVDAETDASAEAAGLVGTETSQGGATWRRRLAPSHRDAVSTFFEPESDQDE